MDSVTTYREPEFDCRGRLIVRGFDLRYALSAILVAERRPMSITELTVALGDRRLAPAGRPSQAISDALKREIGKGRAMAVRRGVYRAERFSRTTWWRIQCHVGRLEVIARSSTPQPSWQSQKRAA